MRRPHDPVGGSPARTLGFYFLMIAATVGGFLLLRHYGGELAAPAPAAGGAARKASAHPNALFHVLLALAVIIAVSRALGALFHLLHQPRVIGEVIAGILLGPSLLGRLAPAASHYVLPPEVAPFLSVLAQVGV